MLIHFTPGFDDFWRRRKMIRSGGNLSKENPHFPQKPTSAAPLARAAPPLAVEEGAALHAAPTRQTQAVGTRARDSLVVVGERMRLRPRTELDGQTGVGMPPGQVAGGEAHGIASPAPAAAGGASHGEVVTPAASPSPPPAPAAERADAAAGVAGAAGVGDHADGTGGAAATAARENQEDGSASSPTSSRSSVSSYASFRRREVGEMQCYGRNFTGGFFFQGCQTYSRHPLKQRYESSRVRGKIG